MVDNHSPTQPRLMPRRENPQMQLEGGSYWRLPIESSESSSPSSSSEDLIQYFIDFRNYQKNIQRFPANSRTNNFHSSGSEEDSFREEEKEDENQLTPAEYQQKFKDMLDLEREEEADRKSSKQLYETELDWFEEAGKLAGKFIMALVDAAEVNLAIGDEIKISHIEWEDIGHIYEIKNSQEVSFILDGSEPIPRQDEDLITSGYTIEFLYNEIPYKRMVEGLYIIRNEQINEHLLKRLLGHPGDIPPLEYTPEPIPVPGIDINDSQREALKAALKSRFLLIQGPPGTGKTSTSAAIVYNIVKQRKEKVLVCATSNNAVNNLTERIFECKLNTLRVMSNTLEQIDPIPEHTFKLHYRVKEIMQEIMCSNDDELSDYRQVIEKYQANALSEESDKVLFEKLKKYIEFHLIQTAEVVCCTCLQALSMRLKHHNFKYVLIDEATQSKEPEIVLPMLLGAEQVILVGDHKQLGPVVLSDVAKNMGFDKSLFVRALRELRCELHSLKTQYRMHPYIANFPNSQFYGGKLQNGVSETDRESASIPWVVPGKPSVFINIQGPEEATSESLRNENEAEYICKLTKNLICNLQILPEDVCIITMYKAQRFHMYSLLMDHPEVAGIDVTSVDSFQGRERDFIIISCVRSNESRKIGFLFMMERVNVALTRAKKGLFIIGDADTLKTHRMWKNLIQFHRENGTFIDANSHWFF